MLLWFSIEISAVSSVPPSALTVVTPLVTVTEPEDPPAAAPLLLAAPEAPAVPGVARQPALPGTPAETAADQPEPDTPQGTGRIPRRATASSSARTRAERDQEALRTTRPIQGIRRDRAEAAERRQLRIEKRSKRVTFNCRVCDISCNSRRALADHKLSRKHRLRKESFGKVFRCDACSREFDTQTHLDRHTRGKYHLRIVSRQ